MRIWTDVHIVLALQLPHIRNSSQKGHASCKHMFNTPYNVHMGKMESYNKAIKKIVKKVRACDQSGWTGSLAYTPLLDVT